MTDTPMASIKVLLVEDDERLAQLTARYLESHHVVVTISAVTAITVTIKFRFNRRKRL